MTSEAKDKNVETVGYNRAIGWMAESVLWSTVAVVGGVVLLAALVALLLSLNCECGVSGEHIVEALEAVR